MSAPHRILLLAFPHGQLLDIAGPVQMFAGANDKLRRQAYRITDEDIAQLMALGYNEDEIFEVTVAVALGASMERLRAALDAIEADGEVDIEAADASDMNAVA